MILQLKYVRALIPVQYDLKKRGGIGIKKTMILTGVLGSRVFAGSRIVDYWIRDGREGDV
jgi:hypothetical protein